MKDLFEKLFASLPLTALVIGAIFIGLGALGGVPIDTPVQVVDDAGRIALYVVGAICLTIAILLVFNPPKSVTFHQKNIYGLTLDTPKSASEDVAAPVDGEHPSVGGEFRIKPPDGMLRLFVYDHNQNKYWPQSTQVIRWDKGQKGGRWIGSVRMGGNPGYEMTVIAALVPPSGQVMCNYYFEMGGYSERLKKEIGEPTNSFWDIYWRHFEGSLPEDFVIIGKVKVIRVK